MSAVPDRIVRTYRLPLQYVDAVNELVMFKNFGHIPQENDAVIPMTYETWKDLGKPENIHVTVEPLLHG